MSIVGTAEAAEAAALLIRGSPAGIREDEVVARIPVPESAAGTIIGAGGATIRLVTLPPITSPYQCTL
jgi:hypothetical protein